MVSGWLARGSVDKSLCHMLGIGIALNGLSGDFSGSLDQAPPGQCISIPAACFSGTKGPTAFVPLQKMAPVRGHFLDFFS